jgi:predicted deacylase
VVVSALIAVGYLWTIYGPQTIPFSFAQKDQCIASPRLFPGLVTNETRGDFAIRRPVRVSLGKLPLYAGSICATAVNAPKEHAAANYREKLFGWGFMSRQITVQTDSYAQLADTMTNVQKLPPDAPLTLKLTAVDAFFTYMVKTGTTTGTCSTHGITVTCDLKTLKLAYAQPYDLQIVRQYKGNAATVLATIPVQTITPVTVMATSIAANSSIENKPTTIVIATDKKLAAAGTVQLVGKGANGAETTMPSTAVVVDNSIQVTLGQELPRRTNFELRIASLRAADSSGLAGNTYVLPFATSGGPRVKGANIGTRDVGFDQAIVLTFDQVLLPTQNLASSIVFTVNGAAQPASITASGNRLTIKAGSTFPVCAQFSVTTNNNIQNQYGVAGDSAWSITSRTTCYTTFSIGTSVRGRPLTAYKFGSGSSTILYMGAMHGSEGNSKQLMTEWIAELNRSPERIPAGRSLVIIPSVNPDGVAANTRFNANNVDLNRNFPANDWKSVVTTPSSKQPTPAGGPAPLSEPESQAVARYIGQISPILVMSFHSKAAVVEANEAGSSVSIANAYASRSHYRAVPKSQSAPIFQYDTTGAMEDWLRDKSGRAAIVVELASSTSSEFSRNRDALWYTVGL